MSTITCTVSQDGKILLCNGTEYDEKIGPLTFHDKEFWVFLILYIFLVLLAGLVSGLTLGLLSLDMTSLKVLKEAGTPSQRRHASKIIPLVKRHHLLLVTLLLTNAAAVETMPVFLDRISDPVTAILVSVTAVLFFGEVFPQAICSRYGLAIGSTLAPLVYFLEIICFVIAFPISKLLDCMLGTEHATFFRRAELKALVDLHGPASIEGHDGGLTYDEVLIIKGALELRDKTVRDAMVPLENVFMLDIETQLTSEIRAKLLSETHSRVPVYENRRDNVIGVLLVKTLISETTESPTLRSLLKDRRVSRRVHYAPDRTPLYDLLNSFQKGKTHLAIVTSTMPPQHSLEISMQHQARSSESGAVIGIITLEDVLEELLQEEIIDETDVYVDVRNRVKVARAKTFLGRSTSTQYDFGSRSTINQETTPATQRRYLSIPNDRPVTERRDTQSHNHSPGDTTPLLH